MFIYIFRVVTIKCFEQGQQASWLSLRCAECRWVLGFFLRQLHVSCCVQLTAARFLSSDPRYQLVSVRAVPLPPALYQYAAQRRDNTSEDVVRFVLLIAVDPHLPQSWCAWSRWLQAPPCPPSCARYSRCCGVGVARHLVHPVFQ